MLSMVSIIINYKYYFFVITGNVCSIILLNTTEGSAGSASADDNDITDYTNILIYVGSNIALQCICDNDTVQWYYNETYISDETLTLVSVEHVDSGVYTCKGQIVSRSINITIYSKSNKPLLYTYSYIFRLFN